MSDLWLRVAALSLMSTRASEAYKAVRIEADQVMDKADRKSVFTPGGQTYLGALSKTAPEAAAGVADAGAFLDWVKANYPDDVDFDLDIIGPEDEVKAVLYQHAKHLVKPIEKVSTKLRAHVLEASNAYGAAAGPNGEVEVPGIAMMAAAPSLVRFKPADGAAEAIIELVKQGRVPVPDLFAETEAPIVDGA